MSSISEEVRTALYSTLNVANVTSLATGGVHHKVIPQDATGSAFVVFQRVSSNRENTFGFTLSMEDDLWDIKAQVDEDADTSKSPQGLAEEILAAADGELGQTLTLGGGFTNHSVERIGDIPEFVETINDRETHTHGFTVRIQSN